MKKEEQDKQGHVLLLSDYKYKQYLRMKEAQERETRTHLSPSNPDSSPQSLQDDISQRAERLITKESETHFNKVLSSVGLKETDAKERLVPINIALPRFKDKAHFDSTMSRLHIRTPSLPSVPMTPGSNIEQRSSQQTERKGFSDIRKAAQTRACQDLEQLQLYISKAKKSTESDRDPLPTRPMSTVPKYEVTETQASTTSPTPKQMQLKPTRKILKRYMSEVILALPAESERSTKSSDGRKTAIRKKSKPRKRRPAPQSPDPVSEESTPSASFLLEPTIYRHAERAKAVNWRENEAERQQMYWKKVLKDIKSQYAKKKKSSHNENIGQLMEIMFRKKPEINADEAKHGDIAKYRTLNEKLYKMMKEDPAELHRITTQPGYMVSGTQRKVPTSAHLQTEWTEEHESAFKSLLRKTHSFNSIAKTRMFKEQEKELPEKKTTRDMEWKYDLHSPWVNDLDYNGDEGFVAVGEDMEVAAAKKSSISNIKRGYNPPPERQDDPEELETIALREKTGLIHANLYKLRQASERMDKRRNFEDAIEGFQMINSWEQHHHLFDEAKARLASHILAGSKIDMIALNKARYSYLSAKIAHQRASNELAEQLYAEAEEKRKILKVKQETFQRDVTVTRNVLRKLYGYLSFLPRRVITTTAHPVGSPLFRTMMVKLGFLPEHFEPRPKRLKAFSTEPQVTASLNLESKKHVSHLNYEKKTEDTRPVSFRPKPSSPQLSERMKARVRGVLTRFRVAKIKKGVRLWQKIYRRYRLMKIFLKGMVKAQAKCKNKALASIILTFRGSFIHRQILKELHLEKRVKKVSST